MRNKPIQKNKMTEKKKKTERKMEERKAKVSEKSEPKEKIVGTRGRIFEGKVIKKFPKRVTIMFERMVYVRKYERYSKSKTKIHARLPDCMSDKIHVGDLIKIREDH